MNTNDKNAIASTWSNQPKWSKSASPPAQRLKRNPYLPKKEEPISPYAPGTNNLAIDIGQVFLMGELSDSYQDNIGFQIHYTYGVSEIFGFDASFGRSSHSDGQFSMTALKSGLRTNLSWFDKVIPYAVFGLGFYKPSVTVFEDGLATESFSPVLFGIHLGPGVDLQITDQLFFGTAVTFHDIFGSNEKSSNGKLVSLGGTYTTFLLHAGITF